MQKDPEDKNNHLTKILGPVEISGLPECSTKNEAGRKNARNTHISIEISFTSEVFGGPKSQFSESSKSGDVFCTSNQYHNSKSGFSD